MLTSSDIPKPLRDRLSEVTRQAVVETFHGVFGTDIMARERRNSQPHTDQEFICLARLIQQNAEFRIFFCFEKNLLEPLIATYYSPDLLEDDETYADAACEIANIVGCNLKAFLNSQGYQLTLEIPLSASAAEAKDANAITLAFSSKADSLLINLQLLSCAETA